ncbi:TonB-dependent siderophore receptor [Oxalicibacterium faecigallinarum]|uniref:Ligand-gated channel protein n=1 Tax=Oxalicibacterium faecigallinarum TaxID=573741 RepID=A0A8J3F6L4_9BURK|nr:TonB-dependent siderophore receptor [Oxalicibacterium faecigallinarum]GGI19444.1 ligand-gated channel protein [Oxalicibacterium faecigallinarum]
MSSSFFSLRPMATAVRVTLVGFTLLPFAAAAQQDNQATDDVLPAINVSSEAIVPGFVTQKATSSTKSDKPLFETPQSITVLTRELLDSRQATTLNEALQTTAGVSSGGFGRRGWDDFNIRGQRASESIYVDGLKLGQGSWIAQEVSGVEQIEIVKGPASINFGQMQPGGIVNMVSKRPRLDAFNQVGFTVGSYGYRQGTFDFGRPLNSENGKAAFRINGMASDSDDQTDFVYFKNRYIAPSLSLDLGARTDLTLLASYGTREYIRQQGLPVRGSILPSPNGPIRRSLYIGDPSIGPYEATQKTIGYALTHRFDSGWTFNQNFRYLDMDVQGRAGFINGTLPLSGLLPRQATFQDIWEHATALDSNVKRTFDFGGAKHTVMVGVDINRDTLYNDTRRCNINTLNVYNPTYGNLTYTNCLTRTLSNTKLSSDAFYLRDQIDFNERLNVNLALRHDRIDTDLQNYLANTRTKEKHTANTGNIALMYKATPNVAPYIGYATSFLPNTDLNDAGALLKPEQGKQTEVGVKLQSDDGRLQGSLAYYDLTRKNVSQTDPNNNNAYVQIGEQRSKGYEAEVFADLRNGWSLQGAVSIIDAVITEDTTLANIGHRVQNVPKRAASLWANYKFSGKLQRWGAGLGMRHESSKTNLGLTFEVPGYTVADANVSYQGDGYRVLLNVKNLFDKDYYAGALNNNVIPLGDPRTVMLKTVFDF